MVALQLVSQEAACNVGYSMAIGLSALGAAGVAGVLTVMGDYISTQEGDQE